MQKARHRRGRIVAGWANQKAIREIMLFLHVHGVGFALAEAMDEGHCGLPAEDLLPLGETAGLCRHADID